MKNPLGWSPTMLQVGTWSWIAKMGSPITIKPVPLWAAHQKQRAAATAPDEHILNHILTCHRDGLACQGCSQPLLEAKPAKKRWQTI